MDRQQLVDYIDDALSINTIKDYCPNGLQIEGKQEIHQLMVGVTLCEPLIDAAISSGADAVLVHHGFFFKGENPCITGMKQRRIKALLEHDINLLAYHLPLDIHPVWGNNVQLAQRLQFSVEGTFPVDNWENLGCYGRLHQPMTGVALAHYIEGLLGRAPLHIASIERNIERIAWITGAAQDGIIQAKALGVDAYLTGEVSERTFHFAKEEGIDFFAAGHHATERYGVQALGLHLAETFDLNYQFVDIDNPV